MTSFWKMLFGPTPGERVNAYIGDWITGEIDLPSQAVLSRPPSDAAAKIAAAIEASQGQWAFEDSQGHSHCYGLGITVSHGPKAIVWQGSRDEHVRHGHVTKLFEAEAHTPDAIVILGALKSRRARAEREKKEAAQRAEEERKAAQAKRVEAAIEKLSRGERLEDPFPNRLSLGGLGQYARCADAEMQAYYSRLMNAR